MFIKGFFGIAALTSLLVGNKQGGLINKGVCYFKECCHPDDGTGYIRYLQGSEILANTLQAKVHGQPLIISPIYKNIRAHLSNDNPARPLVMYFTGWTGTGKTFVANIIAQSIYKEGHKSKFVKYISSSYHFPSKIEGELEIVKQRRKLRDLIRETVSQCARSLIILDEIDKLPAGVVDTLQPLFDYVDQVDGVQYKKAIFIFLSNTGAESLNNLAYKMFSDGKERNDLSSKDLEEIIKKESYNEDGGFHKSSLIKRHSIGVFIAFLPLERQHVKLCIKDEMVSQNIITDNENEIIEEIADEFSYYPEDTRLYSRSGCKGVHEKVVNYLGPSFINGPRGLSSEL